MHPDSLEVFSTLTEVTEYINIQGSHEKFTNLSYFRNLKVIGGRKKVDNYFASLYIVKTALKSLELKSLKKINSGAVVIVENENLCFAPQISWKKIQKSSENQNIIENNKSEAECKAEHLVCDAQCSSEGCWGAGPDQCLSCANYQFGDKCVENCNIYTGMYKAGPKICKACHPECHSTCIGPGPEHCTRCKNARDGPFCVSKCPETKYQSENGTCAACHPNCVKGCTGPLNTVGLNGCNACSKAIISIDVTVERCIHKNESCPDGYYHDYLGPAEEGSFKALIDTILCRKCHPRCKKCTGYGIHQQVCRECTKYKKGEQCEDECSSDHYVDTDNTCQKCHKECTSCVGPTSSDCLKCAHFKIFLDGQPTASNSSAFNCTSTCPSEIQHMIFPADQSIDPYCFSEPLGPKYTGQAKTSTILVAVLIVAVLLLFVLALIFYFCRQKAKAKKEAVKMTMVLTGCEDNEPLRPTNVKPNLAKLRIVKEAELRKGGILGFGAFGKVFKGVWVPEGENVKIPVAIKVLREGSGANTSKEFLEEAYIMASVEHPNLLQLLAVCMTSQMMLITQLMPLGCLLDYVRNHKEKIGSKALLNWCTQIGRGMAYLEEKRLVHRDLAARNVLVQTPNCVKITDFGLAKLLDIDEDEYKAAGGKMPIKWLALECIQHRIFTHKSDVWAFGVTIWELLTYGGRPYENISARNVPELIENGLKLPQPNICTLDIYCIMVSCWMLDADSRPTFKQLADTFAEMARDPGRYLVIPGDKFMRLPSYSHQVCQDEKELIRNLSSAMEGPESLVEADEYLQPKFRTTAAATPISSSGTSTGLDGQTSSIKPSSSSWQNTGTGPESVTSEPARSEPWDQGLLRYAHTGFDVSDLRQYCNAGIAQSDRSDIPSEQSFDTMSKIKEAQVGNLKLDLPLDEDDYLMPSPQQNQAASTYMDLIGEGNQESEEKTQDFRYPGFVGMRSGKTCIDNPEYLMSIPEEESISAQTLGIPTVTETVENNRDGEEHEGNSISRPGNTNFAPQKSVEEESMSDHEYYNDLQRELQPLRRNETTV